jgi:hypothetical protein
MSALQKTRKVIWFSQPGIRGCGGHHEKVGGVRHPDLYVLADVKHFGIMFDEHLVRLMRPQLLSGRFKLRKSEN